MSDRPVALVIGTYDPDFPRNRQMVRLLESHGWDVRTLPIPLWGSSRVDEASGSRVVVGLRLVLAMLRVVLAAVTAPRPDLMITLHPGQFDAAVVAPIARLRGIPLVTDHFISLHETVVADRGLASEGSAAGRLLRWFDRRAIRTVPMSIRTCGIRNRSVFR